VIVEEEGERRRLILDRGRQDVADAYDNVINAAAGEINERGKKYSNVTKHSAKQIWK
jgi:hypothetical protein